jgi:ABC-2 type transport system permease protein
MTLSFGLRRQGRAWGAIAALAPKHYLVYQAWVWLEMLVNILAMIMFVFFWGAVYEAQDSLNGMGYAQTINYVLLVRALSAIGGQSLIFTLGYAMREGLIGIELLRPIDYQLNLYITSLVSTFIGLVVALPLVGVGLLLGLTLPSDPLAWLAFLITLVLGRSVFFLFEWLVACLTFYITEVWGLGVLFYAVGLFFGGQLLPLTLMPDWLQTLANALPFAQALFVPASFLSGIHVPADLPAMLLGQVLWILILFVIGRLWFNVAVRQVTVQGG